ncbi:Flotillin [Melia azedarach]|uniref:Flotillin n=1 Tax=Melia azedarach TaxID=155640 RepID=A0ACC1XAQ1_MELAZ|nr:Flotillin [Melia azedarach]
MEAANQAKVDVAEARMKGQVFENHREANAELAKKKAGWEKEIKVSEVESSKAVALRDAETRADHLSKASVA